MIYIIYVNLNNNNYKINNIYKSLIVIFIGINNNVYISNNIYKL